MADGGVIKQFTGEMVKATGEVVEDVKNEIGQIAQEIGRSVSGQQLTPQQIRQNELDRQKKMAEQRRKLKFYQQTQADIVKAQQGNRQKEDQRLQVQQEQRQQSQRENIEQPRSVARPGQAISEEIARTRQEISKGHGLGG